MDPIVFDSLTDSDTPGVLRAITMLCKKCQQVFASWPYSLVGQEEMKFEHQESTYALDKSANDGCGVCAQLLLGFDEITSWWDHPDYIYPDDIENNSSEENSECHGADNGENEKEPFKDQSLSDGLVNAKGLNVQDNQANILSLGEEILTRRMSSGDTIDGKNPAAGIPHPPCGILRLQRWGDNTKFQLTLSIPYTKGFGDIEDDAWSEIELICVVYEIFLAPTSEQGKPHIPVREASDGVP
jgi:hypothetical protein